MTPVKRVKISCLSCGIPLLIRERQFGVTKYCSHKCYWRSLLGKEPWNKGNGDAPWCERVKKLKAWAIWRTAVFKRDDYTCQDCGVRGGRLVPDHVKPKSLYPELVFDVNNGRTLCDDCHRKTDTYGWKLWNYRKKLSVVN